jgi:hypothetical protein
LNHISDDAVVLLRPFVEDSVFVGGEERYSKLDQTRETCESQESSSVLASPSKATEERRTLHMTRRRIRLDRLVLDVELVLLQVERNEFRVVRLVLLRSRDLLALRRGGRCLLTAARLGVGGRRRGGGEFGFRAGRGGGRGVWRGKEPREARQTW